MSLLSVRRLLKKTISNTTMSERRMRTTFSIESLEDRTVPSSCSPAGPVLGGSLFGGSPFGGCTPVPPPPPSVLTVGNGYQYPSITAALNVAGNNSTIEVYPGTYNEAVVIKQSGLQLIGEGSGVVVQPLTVTPVTLSGVNVGGAAIDIYSSNVTVTGLTVDGSQDTDGNLWAGIRVIEGGSATIKNDTVEGMINGPSDTNVAIQIGTSLVSGKLGSGTGTVTSNTILEYAGAGILVDGSCSQATIQKNSITGQGTGNNGVVEYGIQVSNGGSAQICGNTIRNNTVGGSTNAPSNPTPTSAGIFFYNDANSNSSASSNCLTGNDDGILVQLCSGGFCSGIQITGNSVQDNYGYAGIFVLSSSNVSVSCNNVSNNTTYNGIALNYSSNIQVIGNTVSKNGVSGSATDGIFDSDGKCDLISGNCSSSNSGNGINIDDSTGDTLIFNGTSNNTLNGVQVTGGSKNSIGFGLSSCNLNDGILLIDTSCNAVGGNVLTNNGGYGLQLQSAPNTLILCNVIYGNTAGSTSIS